MTQELQALRKSIELTDAELEKAGQHLMGLIPELLSLQQTIAIACGGPRLLMGPDATLAGMAVAFLLMLSKRGQLVQMFEDCQKRLNEGTQGK